MRKSTYQEGKEEDPLQVLNKSLEIGIDEVGRGSIFGPVFSAVAVISRINLLKLKNLGVEDSKKLSSKKRNLLLPNIYKLSKGWGLGQSSVREIDKYGIRHATELSMIRAINKLKFKPLNILVDGVLPLRIWKGDQTNIIKGDSKYISIAAASIIAKVNRDLLMSRLEKKYKGYFISKNKGYGTKQHFLSIKENGMTDMHRKTFLKF